jgi:N6-L-threonylcarbamoyladenine synthase
MTKILAIESSCDETSAAVIAVKAHKINPVSHIVASQTRIHLETQGVVPEVAARAHLKKIGPVVQRALQEAQISLKNIDYIAVTQGPGLVASLLVGTEFAKALSFVTNTPLLPVNHMLGHLYSPLLQNPKLQFPNVSLIVSGGHTYLVLMKNTKDFKVIGSTVDDAVGEAFDKVARMLKLPYPGGPQISKIAALGKKDYDFPRPMLHANNFNFSFAGLKTAVLYKIRDEKLKVDDEQTKADIAYSFENAAIEVLVKKTLRAAKKYKAKSIAISGGVAANKKLRDALSTEAKANKIKFYVPEFSLCTDNALMIANAAAIMLQNGKKPVNPASVKATPVMAIR